MLNDRNSHCQPRAWMSVAIPIRLFQSDHGGRVSVRSEVELQVLKAGLYDPVGKRSFSGRNGRNASLTALAQLGGANGSSRCGAGYVTEERTFIGAGRMLDFVRVPENSARPDASLEMKPKGNRPWTHRMWAVRSAEVRNAKFPKRIKPPGRLRCSETSGVGVV